MATLSTILQVLFAQSLNTGILPYYAMQFIKKMIEPCKVNID